MWRSRTGSPWRDVPESYGSWSTVYDGFRVWARDGVFQTLMEAVIAEAAARDDVDLSLVSVDSTVARAHHHAAGLAVDPELLEDLEKAVAEEKGATAKGRNDPVGEGPGGREDPERRIPLLQEGEKSTTDLHGHAVSALIADAAPGLAATGAVGRDVC
jgi:hypothetical protein